MSFDAALAGRIRARIGTHPALVEKAMFGGLVFMVDGNLAVGVYRDELMVRVGKAGHAKAVARPGARTMAFTTRPMIGWIVVDRVSLEDEATFAAWVDEGVAYAESLPAK
jgi:TfoX/Sxy family transcriptional regulator of competence genes